jgi:hypothetical protein
MGISFNRLMKNSVNTLKRASLSQSRPTRQEASHVGAYPILRRSGVSRQDYARSVSSYDHACIGLWDGIQSCQNARTGLESYPTAAANSRTVMESLFSTGNLAD